MPVELELIFLPHPKQKESVPGRAQVWRGLGVWLCSLVS
jgi:hypothetical protein